MSATKVCSACGIRKSVHEFYRNRGKLRNQCKACFAERPSAVAKRLAAGERDERRYMELVLIDRENGIVQHVRAPIVSSAPIASLKRMQLTIDFYSAMGCKIIELPKKDAS